MANNSEQKGLAPVWFKFFLDAGIPPADAGNYAVTFTENRIQPEMMTDLTKEYLAEMGITVLGDVIAILKHARVVHAQTAREKALRCTGLNQTSVDESVNLKSVSTSLPLKRSSTSVPVAAAGVLTKSSRLSLSDQQTAAVLDAVSTVNLRKTMTAKSTSLQTLSDINLNSGTSSKKTVASASHLQMSTDNSVTTATARPAVAAAAAGRKTSKAAVNKSVVPAVDIEKTNKLTEQQRQVEGPKKLSIFDRLGSEVQNDKSLSVVPSKPTVVPSWSAVVPSNSTVVPRKLVANEAVPLATTQFTVTMSGVDQYSGMKSAASNSKANTTSLFGRLGNSSRDAASPEVEELSTVGSKFTALNMNTQTRKTLQDRLGPVQTLAVKPVTSAVRSDGLFGTAAQSSAKLRLGPAHPASTVSALDSAKRRLGPVPTAAATDSMKLRLGPMRVDPSSPTTKIQLGTKRLSTGSTLDAPATKVIRLATSQSTADSSPPTTTRLRLTTKRTIASPTAGSRIKPPIDGSLVPAAKSSAYKLQPRLGTGKQSVQRVSSGNTVGVNQRLGNTAGVSTRLNVELKQPTKGVKARLGPQKVRLNTAAAAAAAVAGRHSAANSAPKIIRLKPLSSSAGVFSRLGV